MTQASVTGGTSAPVEAVMANSETEPSGTASAIAGSGAVSLTTGSGVQASGTAGPSAGSSTKSSGEEAPCAASITEGSRVESSGKVSDTDLDLRAPDQSQSPLLFVKVRQLKTHAQVPRHPQLLALTPQKENIRNTDQLVWKAESYKFEKRLRGPTVALIRILQ